MHSNYYELYHHGILGQKWGRRRYQNSDGTWTEEGKKRRRLSASEVKSASDEELKKRIERLNLEKRYLDLERDTGSTSKGKKIAKAAFVKIAVVPLTAVAAQLVTIGLMTAVNKAGNRDIFRIPGGGSNGMPASNSNSNSDDWNVKWLL